METKQIYLSLKRGERLEEALYLYKIVSLKKSDISKKLGIPYSTIKHWIDNFAINNIHSLPNMSTKSRPEPSNSLVLPKSWRRKSPGYRKSFKNKAFGLMLTTEAKFKISIRKKAGAKQ